MIKVVVAGQGGRTQCSVNQVDKVNINNLNFNFTDEILPNAFNIKEQYDTQFFQTDVAVIQTVMATQKTDTIAPGDYQLLMPRSMYMWNDAGFLIGDFRSSSFVCLVSGDCKMKIESIAGLVIQISKMVILQ